MNITVAALVLAQAWVEAGLDINEFVELLKKATPLERI